MAKILQEQIQEFVESLLKNEGQDIELVTTFAQLIVDKYKEAKQEKEGNIGPNDYHYLVIAEFLNAITKLPPNFLSSIQQIERITSEIGDLVLPPNFLSSIQQIPSKIDDFNIAYKIGDIAIKLADEKPEENQDVNIITGIMSGLASLSRALEYVHQNEYLFFQILALNEKIQNWHDQSKTRYGQNDLKMKKIDALFLHFNSSLDKFCNDYAKDQNKLQPTAAQELVKELKGFLDDENNREILGEHRFPMINHLKNIALITGTLGLVFFYSKVRYGTCTFFTKPHSAKQTRLVEQNLQQLSVLVPPVA